LTPRHVHCFGKVLEKKKMIAGESAKSSIISLFSQLPEYHLSYFLARENLVYHILEDFSKTQKGT
jgi:hypothetical protein